MQNICAKDLKEGEDKYYNTYNHANNRIKRKGLLN